MQTKHRRAAKAKRERNTNRTAWAAAIVRHWEVEQDHVVGLIKKLNDIFGRMRNGGKDQGDFDDLASVFNVGFVRAQQIDNLAGPEEDRASTKMRLGMEALEAADARRSKFGHFVFGGPGLTHVQDAIDLYAQIMRLSTKAQMEAAQVEADRRQVEAVMKQFGCTYEQARASVEAPWGYSV